MKELLEQIRHECRNAVASMALDLRHIAEAQTVISRAIIDMCNEKSRIERAINFLDELEKHDKD